MRLFEFRQLPFPDRVLVLLGVGLPALGLCVFEFVTFGAAGFFTGVAALALLALSAFNCLVSEVTFA